MGATIQHRTWYQKRRSVGENRDKSSLREDDELDEESGKNECRFVDLHICSFMVGLKNIALMQISYFSQSCCRNYCSLNTRTLLGPQSLGIVLGLLEIAYVEDAGGYSGGPYGTNLTDIASTPGFV
ncbi:hypothetical protein TNCV_1972791 [Trichonephila clavipes]|nr:hypothetical protein TNCV_1972791 [Trichonephila clavipes]